MSDPCSGFTIYGRTPSGVEYTLNVGVDPAAGAAEIAKNLATIDAALKTAGFTRSERLEPKAWGGGGGGGKPRTETPVPPSLERWSHCGVPALYIVYNKDGAKGSVERGVPAGKAEMWACAKDKQCETVTSGQDTRRAVNFDMKPAKKTATSPTGAAPVNGPAAAAPTGQPKPIQGYGDFLNAALPLGYTKPEIIKFARTNEAELAKMGADGWTALLEKLRDFAQTKPVEVKA